MEILSDKYYWVKNYAEVNDALSLAEKEHYFEDIVFEDNFIIDEFKHLKTVIFDKCTFKGKLYITQSVRHVEFVDCSFRELLSFENCKKCWVLNLEQCTFYDSIYFENIAIIKLYIVRCKQKFRLRRKFLNVDNYLCSELIYTENDFLNDINIDLNVINHIVSITPGQYKNNLYLSSTENEYGKGPRWSKDVYLKYTGKSKGDISICNAFIDKLDISGVNSGCNLICNNVTVSTVHINNYSNYGTSKISDVKSYHDYSGEISINNSYLGKLELLDCDLSKFNKVRLTNSSFIDIIPMNIRWCEKVKDVDYTEPTEFKRYREIYRQLKVVMLRQNDKPMEQFFERQEMLMYQKQLAIERNIFKLGERLILWSNNWSNNFGQSWIQALTWLLFLNLIMYNATFSILNYHTGIRFSFVHHISNYLEFINPVHGFKVLFNLEKIEILPGMAKLVDSISRIINSFLLFQFIRAFRKLAR